MTDTDPADYIGDFIKKPCPKCGADLLANKIKEEWCSSINCDFGIDDLSDDLKSFFYENKNPVDHDDENYTNRNKPDLAGSA